jgi:hypothetical protein
MAIAPAWIVVDSSPTPVTIRIGKPNPGLDRLLERHGARGCAWLPGRLPGEIALEFFAGWDCMRLDAQLVPDDAYADVDEGELWIGVPQRLAAVFAVELHGRGILIWHELGGVTHALDLAAEASG